MKRRRAAGPIILMCLLSAAVILLSASVGTVRVPVPEALRALLGILPAGLKSLLGITDADASYSMIILQVRMPRIMLGFAVGAALGAAGACYQGLLANPLAD